jgi:hypothetical protein
MADARDLRPAADQLIAQQAARAEAIGTPAEEGTARSVLPPGTRTMQNAQGAAQGPQHGDMVGQLYAQQQALMAIASDPKKSWGEKEDARVALKYLNPTLQTAMTSDASIQGHRATLDAARAGKDFDRAMKTAEYEQKIAGDVDKMLNPYTETDDKGVPRDAMAMNKDFARRFWRDVGDPKGFYKLSPEEQRQRISDGYLIDQALNNRNASATGGYNGRMSDNWDDVTITDPNPGWMQKVIGDGQHGGVGLKGWIANDILPGKQKTIMVGNQAMSSADAALGEGGSLNTTLLEALKRHESRREQKKARQQKG